MFATLSSKTKITLNLLIPKDMYRLLNRIEIEKKGYYGLVRIPPWLEKILNFASLECLEMLNVNIFNLEYGHEKYTLTSQASLLKRGNPFCKRYPLLRFFFCSPSFVSEPTFSSPL